MPLYEIKTHRQKVTFKKFVENAHYEKIMYEYSFFAPRWMELLIPFSPSVGRERHIRRQRSIEEPLPWNEPEILPALSFTFRSSDLTVMWAPKLCQEQKCFPVRLSAAFFLSVSQCKGPATWLQALPFCFWLIDLTGISVDSIVWILILITDAFTNTMDGQMINSTTWSKVNLPVLKYLIYRGTEYMPSTDCHYSKNVGRIM